MDDVAAQYEAYPYPERDPADEARRLITGSPSHPVEMDHYLWGGVRDWSRPLRALFAGGGTGDGLIQFAALMARAGRRAEVVYLDTSEAARKVAEARAAARGLEGLRFETGSLLGAADFGPFDYIDCCGVIHHLPDPDAGFAALAAALARGGGIGLMVYAPYGRSGVYPLQEAFGALFAGLPPADRLAAARALLPQVPEDHPFRRNRLVGDHTQGDAGFYDLLLHGRDRAYTVPELLAALEQAGLDLASFVAPGDYDLSLLTGAGADLPEPERMAIAEKLRGTLRTHVAYLRRRGEGGAPPAAHDMALVPHVRAAALGKADGPEILKRPGRSERLDLPRGARRLIRLADGRRSLAQIAAAANLDPVAFGSMWGRIDRALRPWNLLNYSGLLRG